MDASLAERLATFAEAVRTQRPAFSDAVERLVRRLRESGAGSKSLFLKYLICIDAIAVDYLVNLNTLVPRNVLLVDAANSGLQCQRRLKS